MNSNDTQNTRPFGFWIKAVDRLMAAEFATAFEAEGASRRDWRLLNIIDGTVTARRPLHGGKLRGLLERGWIEKTADGWTLTDDGRAAKERLGAIVDGIRTKVSDAVSPEDLATTIATLEQIATAFGWDEESPLPRGRRHGVGGRGHGHGFPRHFGRPFGRGFGPGFGPRFDHDADGDHNGCRGGEHAGGHHEQHPHHGHHEQHRGMHPHHEGGPQRAARFSQHAYERGFDAGYSRGRDA